MKRQIRLNAFDMATPGHIQQGLWRHPRDRSRDYTKLGYWTELARLLERGLFDGLFLADVLGVCDVHGGAPDAALRGGVQIPLLDPWCLVPAMAAVTEHLAFAVTGNLAYEPPYLFARRLSSLDHLTQGRIAWNIVTGYLDSAARATGMAAQMPHDDRYALADAYMRAVYPLWEESWEDGALARGAVYTDPASVHRVSHDGPHYPIDAVHLCEPSPQRTPLLFQAGTSPQGRSFAGRHAECVFVNGTTPHLVAELVADLRARAAPRPILVFAGATLVVGRTMREAQDLLAEYAAFADPEAMFAHASASLGIDLARYGMDEPIETATSQAVASNLAAARRMAGPALTKRRLLAQSPLGSRQAPVVGDPAFVADALQHWVAVADEDGFNLSRTVMPECLDAVVDLLVPELQRRGLFKTAYTPGTAREKLFGSGPRLSQDHPARRATWRNSGRP
jgi:FMN-dependent oxidoreductase (nitrilotriacetate monooxygenase family)